MRRPTRRALLFIWLATIVGLTGHTLAQSTSGPVAQWHFDEGSGTTAQDSAGTAHGALSGGATFEPGFTGTAVRLDGVNDSVALPAFDVAGNGLTVAAWVKSASFPSTTVQPRIISKASDTSEQSHYWMLSLINNGQNRLRFRINAGGATTTLVASSGTLPLNAWYHVAATYDGASMRLYLNGTQVGAVPKTGARATSSSVPVSVGRNPDNTHYFHGSIDDLRVYDRALSAGEIAALRDPAQEGNQPPDVSLTEPSSGAAYTSPASIRLSAAANDPDGAIAAVDFYAGITRIGSVSASPYTITWQDVPPGTYSFTAAARDDAGGVTVSAERSVTVRDPALPSRAVFESSSNHDTAVDRYVLEIFPDGADPAVNNPSAAADLGKPPVVDGRCSADVSAAIATLPPGSYVATVTAIGPGGTARSTPSAPFAR